MSHGFISRLPKWEARIDTSIIPKKWTSVLIRMTFTNTNTKTRECAVMRPKNSKFHLKDISERASGVLNAGSPDFPDIAGDLKSSVLRESVPKLDGEHFEDDLTGSE